MKIWSVILAATVIFGAGLVSGVLIGRSTAPLSPPAAPKPPGKRIESRQQAVSWLNRISQFLEMAEKDLEITPEQKKEIEKIFHDSQTRLHTLWEEIKPRLSQETQLLRERILQVLTPEQREKWEREYENRYNWKRFQPKTPPEQPDQPEQPQ